MKRGFTLPELIVVMAIIAGLIAVTSPSLLPLQYRTSSNSSVNQLIADIKLQQFKAMSGDAENRDASDSYGVYVEQNQYTLFHGVYSQGEPANTVISIEEDLSTTFPSSQIVFTQGSGEIGSSGDIVITTPIESKTLSLNEYGTIVAQN